MIDSVYHTNEKTKTYNGNAILLSDGLLAEITKALKSIDGYGSIEIYVQNHNVTQITVRNIKKTNHLLVE